MIIIIKSYFFDGVAVPGGYDREYSATDHAAYYKAFFVNGVFGNKNADAMKVFSNSFNVTVSVGEMIVNGYQMQIVVPETLVISEGSGKYRLIARWNGTSGVRGFQLMLIKGGASYPALVRNDAIYDMCLANIDVSGTTSTVVDTRSNADICGFASFAGLPSYQPPGEIPWEVWLYSIFPSELTPEQKALIESNSTFMDIWGKSRMAQVSRPATVTIASKFAKNKLNADYICDGVNDTQIINEAIASLPTDGGTILLSEGVFYLKTTSGDGAESSPLICIRSDKNITIKGAGYKSTVFSRSSGSKLTQNQNQYVVLIYADGSTYSAEQYSQLSFSVESIGIDLIGGIVEQGHVCGIKAVNEIERANISDCKIDIYANKQSEGINVFARHGGQIKNCWVRAYANSLAYGITWGSDTYSDNNHSSLEHNIIEADASEGTGVYIPHAKRVWISNNSIQATNSASYNNFKGIDIGFGTVIFVDKNDIYSSGVGLQALGNSVAATNNNFSIYNANNPNYYKNISGSGSQFIAFFNATPDGIEGTWTKSINGDNWNLGVDDY